MSLLKGFESINYGSSFDSFIKTMLIINGNYWIAIYTRKKDLKKSNVLIFMKNVCSKRKSAKATHSIT